MLCALLLWGAGANAETLDEEKYRLLLVDSASRILTLFHEDGETVLARFPVVIPRRIPNKPIEGVVRGVIRDPWWYPTEPTRVAYLKKHGVELRKEIPPGDPQNAMGVGKILIDFVTVGANQAVRIHGTNHPELFDLPAEERALSRGCIRLLDKDWLALAALISGRRTRVRFN